MAHIQVGDSIDFPKLTKHRRSNRVVAFTFCFQLVFSKAKREVFLKNVFEHNKYNFENTFAYELIEGVAKNLTFLKAIIQKHLKKDWLFERLQYQDQAILLLACYEILFKDTPFSVVINESLEIIKMYSQKDASKWINAVLDKIKIKEKKK